MICLDWAIRFDFIDMARPGLSYTLSWRAKPSTNTQLLNISANVLLNRTDKSITYYDSVRYVTWRYDGSILSYNMGDRNAAPSITRMCDRRGDYYKLIQNDLYFRYSVTAYMKFKSRYHIEMSGNASLNILVTLAATPEKITRQLPNPHIKLCGYREDAEKLFKHYMKIRDDMLRLGY